MSAQDEPKAATLESYRVRMARVLDHIDAEIAEGRALDLDSLADVACLSRFHFHRIYRSMLGETAAQTVRRRRLHAASTALAQSDAALAEIAASAGYAAPEAFARAFAAVYGLTPSAFRARAAAARAGAHAVPSPSLDIATMENADMTETLVPAPDVRIETRPALRLAAIGHVGPYSEISRAFERLTVWAGPRNIFGPNAKLVGIYYDDPTLVAPEALRADAAIVVAEDVEPTEPARLATLQGGEHAVLTHRGPYAHFAQSYDYLFGRWFPESGRTPDDAPLFEYYLNTPFDTAPDSLVTEICVPLAPA